MSLCPVRCGRATVGSFRKGDCRLCWLAINDSRYSKIVRTQVVTIHIPAPKILRPDRCNHFTGRTEFRSGCGGWKCKGGCTLGQPAVPGEHCQGCEAYEPDPDYAGKGPAGWQS